MNATLKTRTREGIQLHNHTLFLFLFLRLSFLLVLPPPVSMPPSLIILPLLSPPFRIAFLFPLLISPLCPLVLLILQLQRKRATFYPSPNQ